MGWFAEIFAGSMFKVLEKIHKIRKGEIFPHLFQHASQHQRSHRNVGILQDGELFVQQFGSPR
jgi:hypothetical protein